jgi:large subunit ribosomal protein L30
MVTKKTADGTKKASAPKGPRAGATISIRLEKGTIACNPNQRATINGLGLKRREQVVTLENTPSVRGMIKKVLHLVSIVHEKR